MSEPYPLGTVQRVPGAFTNAAGAAADPSTLGFTYQKPGEAQTVLTYPASAAIVKDSTGNYHVDLALDTPGVWLWRWVSTGTPATALEGAISVAPSALS